MLPLLVIGQAANKQEICNDAISTCYPHYCFLRPVPHKPALILNIFSFLGKEVLLKKQFISDFIRVSEYYLTEAPFTPAVA